jgi:hypothetical protein
LIELRFIGIVIFVRQRKRDAIGFFSESARVNFPEQAIKSEITPSKAKSPPDAIMGGKEWINWL